MTLSPLGLYIHLPWSEKKCPYCDFNSHERQDLPETAYVATLLADLEQESVTLPRQIDTIFIGGGTPSLFSASAVHELLDGIRQRVEVAADAEITMEANPGSSELDRFAGYREAGVNRFSLGVQSFHDAALSRLGRVHNSGEARSAIAMVQRAKPRSFNVDLMHGLPEQTAEDGLADLQSAVETNPPHLSWYQLTIEPNTRFYKYPPLLPDEPLLGELEDWGSELLRSAGYQRYEVSAWAHPGAECRHNLNYWRFGDYLAIGAGAHGKVTTETGEILRYAKTRRPEDYMRSGGVDRRNIRQLTSAELPGEFAMNALRLTEGFSRELFEERTGLKSNVIEPLVEQLQEQGLLVSDADVRATPLGYRFLDDVIGRFFDLEA